MLRLDAAAVVVAATSVLLAQLALFSTVGAQNQIYIDPLMIRLLVHQNFLNLTSVTHGPLAYQALEGAPLTVEVFMSGAYTSNYDYMIEGCLANGYPFINHRGCMQCDAIFVRQIETPQYWQNGRDKRTLIHLLAYQPLDTNTINIECSLLLVPCCGCAQNACERGVKPGADTPSNYQRFVKSVQLQLLNGAVGVSEGTATWWCAEIYELSWWLILIITLLAVLLIVALVLLICCCLGRRRRRNVQPTISKLHLETDHYRTPSESLSQYTNVERHVSRSNIAHIATNT
uniref:Uncharacterized protein n=1 Tax=Plectus sambesii TaxID=2011161 RepID=A0A914WZ35_9BILA